MPAWTERIIDLVHSARRSFYRRHNFALPEDRPSTDDFPDIGDVVTKLHRLSLALTRIFMPDSNSLKFDKYSKKTIFRIDEKSQELIIMASSTIQEAAILISACEMKRHFSYRYNRPDTSEEKKESQELSRKLDKLPEEFEAVINKLGSITSVSEEDMTKINGIKKQIEELKPVIKTVAERLKPATDVSRAR